MITNLPNTAEQKPIEVRDFFDRYYQTMVSFPCEQIDAVTGFFLKRGFDVESGRTISIVLLNQAKSDGVAVFSLLDALNPLTDLQLNQVVAQVLNETRSKTSLLGYKVETPRNKFEERNILI